jgi:hypothetical protein
VSAKESRTQSDDVGGRFSSVFTLPVAKKTA